MKTSKLCTLLLLLTFTIACKKEMKYETIQFHYADGYAGVYTCVVSKVNTGSLNELDTQYVVNIQVTDMRNDRMCLFYFDYLNDSAIVKSNGYYYYEPNESYTNEQGIFSTIGYGFFRNDSLFYHLYKRVEYNHYGNATFNYTTDIQGKKQ